MAMRTILQCNAAQGTDRIACAVGRPGVVTVMRSIWLLLALVAMACIGTARAETTSVTLQVSAVVLPHARLQADDSPVSITATDIQRGYRDVSRRYRLVTNEPDRVILQLNPRVGLTTGVDISGLQSKLHMDEATVEVSQPFAREFTLSYRLWLDAAAQPGHYAMPVQVAAVLR